MTNKRPLQSRGGFFVYGYQSSLINNINNIKNPSCLGFFIYTLCIEIYLGKLTSRYYFASTCTTFLRFTLLSNATTRFEPYLTLPSLSA